MQSGAPATPTVASEFSAEMPESAGPRPRVQQQHTGALLLSKVFSDDGVDLEIIAGNLSPDLKALCEIDPHIAGLVVLADPSNKLWRRYPDKFQQVKDDCEKEIQEALSLFLLG